MGKVFSEPGRPHPHVDEAFARKLERVAWLMDRAFTVPGTKISVGLDALLGLLPIGGDLLTGVVQAGLVLAALGRYRVPRTVAARMMANVVLDVLVGAIPIVGDLFDVAFKANTRNIKLLEPFRPRPEPEAQRFPLQRSISISLPTQGMSLSFLVLIGLVLFVVLALVFVGFLTVIRWLLRG